MVTRICSNLFLCTRGSTFIANPFSYWDRSLCCCIVRVKKGGKRADKCWDSIDSMKYGPAEKAVLPPLRRRKEADGGCSSWEFSLSKVVSGVGRPPNSGGG